MAGRTAAMDKPPGKGGRGRYRPRGRQVTAPARSAVEAMLGEAPRSRDLLIEHLHRIQDSAGVLRTSHLVALAEVMGLPLAEVYEVASFYHNFEIVEDADGDGAAETGAVPLTVHVCESLPCIMAGADRLARELAGRAAQSGGTGLAIRVKRAACLGRCDHAPACRVGDIGLGDVAADDLWPHLTADDPAVSVAALAAPVTAERFEAYCAGGGYETLQALHRGEQTPEQVIGTLENASLRGLGGAGFPTGRKWRFVRAEAGPRLMVVNGDESEPGTFKDRHFLRTRPHRMLEGALIGAWAVGASDLYVYIRDEYADIRSLLAEEMPKLDALNLDLPRLHLRRGAGAYICGEESALLESLEGKRGLPRHKPPFPAQVGLFGRPTLINNVETLYWIPEILTRGPEWFAEQGQEGHPGIRGYSVSGRVRNPGVYLAPAGTTVRELIEDHAGGMAPGHRFAAYLPGGASGGILPAGKGDLPLDFGSLDAEGCLVGSHAVIVLSDQDDVAGAARNLMEFFRNESCGQCTPCRVGCTKAATLMQAPVWDRDLLSELSAVMTDASICGLGQAAPNGLRSVLRFFSGQVPGGPAEAASDAGEGQR